MKKTVLSVISLFVCLTLMGAKGPDMKYLRESAAKVWGMDLPQFDPNTVCEGEAYDDASAAYIASYFNIESDYTPVDKVSIYSVSTRSRVAENNVRVLKRYMVRLNDAKAIEDFSDFKFKPYEFQKMQNIPVYERKEAFGARVHKPDGTVVNVDMNATLTETEGKKGKSSVLHKIAIPALEVGDVLEYFYLTEQYMLANQSVAFDLNLFGKYPVRNCSLDMKLHPEQTTEINMFNGLPLMSRKESAADGRMQYHWEDNDLPAADYQRWSAPKRQIPYMRVCINDNVSTLFPKPQSSRRSGVYVNIESRYVLAEIAELFSIFEIPAKDISSTLNIVRDYQKSHPDLTDDEIADAAWRATLYTTLTSKETYDEWLVTAMFKDVMDKLQTALPVKLAVTASREEVPVDKIAGYKQATPLVMVGDRPFLYSTCFAYQPGELPGEYAGETAFTMAGKRAKVFEHKQFDEIKLPAMAMGSNTKTVNATISLPNPGADEISIDYSNTARGIYKYYGEVLIYPHDFVGHTESILGMSEKNRSNRKLDFLDFEKSRRNALEELPDHDFGMKDFTVDSASVTSFGFVPGEKELVYKIKFSNKDKGIVSTAGDDIIVNIGSLINPADVKEERPTRDISIFTSGPYNQRLDISFVVPEGYAVDPDALKDMQINHSNRCGLFFVQTALDSSGNVRMAVNRRNSKAIYPPELWPEFLELREKASAFATSSIVLHKVD